MGFKFVILKINLTVPPSSQPCWSAKLNLISLLPAGLNEDAVCGAKETDWRCVIYELVFLPEK